MKQLRIKDGFSSPLRSPWKEHNVKIIQPAVNAAVLAAACSSFIILADNALFRGSLFKLIDPRSAHGLFVSVAAFVILAGTLTALFLLFSINYLFKPTLMAVLILASIIGYYSSGYGVIFDHGMLRNIMETDLREAVELSRVRSRPFVKELGFRLASIAIALTMVASAAFLSYKDLTLMGREHKELRLSVNPLYPVYAALTYGRHRGRTATAVTLIGADARQKKA